ncbi:MAG: hypothetical protein ACREBU_20445 [Nitrososphaera sp.]
MVQFRRRKDSGRVFPIRNMPSAGTMNNLLKQDGNRPFKERVTEEVRAVEIPGKKEDKIVVQEKEVDVEIDAGKKQ